MTAFISAFDKTIVLISDKAGIGKVEVIHELFELSETWFFDSSLDINLYAKALIEKEKFTPIYIFDNIENLAELFSGELNDLLLACKNLIFFCSGQATTRTFEI